jgi:hypothetical protein
MAKEVVERYLDDLDGSEGASPITFGLDSVTYEIDLNQKHENELRMKLGPYVEVARRVRLVGRGQRQSTLAGKERNTAIRAWALEEGVELPARGRFADVVQEAFNAQDGDMLRTGLGLE